VVAISNYPSGFNGGALIKGTPLYDQIDGNVYFVSSGTGAAGNSGETPQSPVDTIQGAINKCTASNNDWVMVMPGHAESVAAQIDFNKAGVTVWGLGNGNLRPTLTNITTAADIIDVSAANMMLANVIFAFSTIDTTSADVNVDAAGFTLLNTRHHGSTTSSNKWLTECAASMIRSK